MGSAVRVCISAKMWYAVSRAVKQIGNGWYKPWNEEQVAQHNIPAQARHENKNFKWDVVTAMRSLPPQTGSENKS